MMRVPYDKVFFISDTHFYHINIIKYCDRPFNDINEMNKAIITLWNETVPKDGIVFHLGDVCFGGKEKWESMISQLNGDIYLIRGNHDMKHPPQTLFKGIYDQLMIMVEGDEEIPEQKVFMHHFPFITWPEQSKNCWMLFGHIHQNDAVHTDWLNRLSPGQLNVGVDNNNYCPFSFQEVKERITKNCIQNA